MEETIKIRGYLSIGLANANRDDVIDTGITPAERAAMTDDEWQAVCDEQMREWAYNYIEMNWEPA